MAELVYLLCAVTSVGCAGLLWRAYRQRGARLLLWSSVCFAGLAINNILLFADLVLVPAVDLSTWRAGLGLGALLVLVFGLVWDTRE
jgi:hydrogenase/urease accessory protein HupE